MLTSKTTQLIDELNRLLNALEAYKESPGEWNSSATHAAAVRASQDVSRALVLWRRGPKPFEGVK